ncbi:acetate--CoA ligase [bacterium (Candidatus Gribaldobacteria) CG_4_10_14_0_8_um_filter_33_9]|uniref:Acetate--CoA ligase n=1 Tax=bacterium (Candidatus Gribaldobacteria) CG_4_10_14_0_8_um_filter_33_9 TaxID=2014266 RepID=A0A2M7RP32_9BACT|nr:MAG: acetate--CoA ligase [bacterium (Candidatus Gribaldobacteria) CG_4_10_14_0_8_um_filter_33_9]
MIKEGELYFPTKEFQKKAWVKNAKIYKEAEKDPVKFWENLAAQLFWFEKWEKPFVHQPPYFQWFVNGKINITSNIFEKNLQGWENIKNKAALIWEPEPIEQSVKILTYEELFKKVCCLANGLKKLGVKKGDRVGIYLPMISEAIISILACARIGVVHAVVFSAFSSAALKARLVTNEAKILITADGYYRRGQIVNLKQNADEGIKETKIEKVIVVKRAENEINWNSEKDVWYEDLIRNESEQCEAKIMDSEDLLFLLATSGSTGSPKQVMHTCGGYTIQTYWTGKWIFDFHKNDIFWCTSDPGWVTGHTYTIYSPLLNGITTLMFEGAPDWPEPDRWAQIIEKHKITIFYTAPTAIRMFEKYGADVIKKYKFATLRLLGSVGEPIDESAWLWYFREVGKERCPIVDTWWQTETGGILITSLPGIGPFKPAFTGLPFPGVKIDILENNLVILPPFSPGMFRGIYKNPQKYLETYWSQTKKNVYFTSDVAHKNEQGLIRIIGRVDDVIKVAGHRLTTGELEAAINLHSEIIESAAIGIPDEIKGEAPVVFVVYRGEKTHDEIKKEVIAQIKKEIGPIALPKEIYIIKDLPKTRSGKIMRRILKKLLVKEELGDLSTLRNPEIVEEIRKIIKL